MWPELFKSTFFLLVLAAVALEAAADVMFKKWSMTASTWLFVSAFAIYLVGTLLWAFSLKYEYLSKAISVFTVLNLIIVSLPGVFLFNEDLSLVNKLGIVLGILSVIMVQI